MKLIISTLLISAQLATMSAAQMTVDEYTKEQLVEACSVWNRHTTYKEVDEFFKRAATLHDYSAIHALFINRNYTTRCNALDVLSNASNPSKKEIVCLALESDAMWIVPQVGELASSHDTLLAKFTGITKSLGLDVDREKLSDANYRKSLIKELGGDSGSKSGEQPSSNSGTSSAPEKGQSQNKPGIERAKEQSPKTNETSTGLTTWYYVLGGAAALALIVWGLRMSRRK